MSAICGILHTDGRPVSGEVLTRMVAALHTWGPDGSDMWREGNVGLGHLMFHNTPEAVGDSMPKRNRAGNLVITGRARLDNRDELFEQLGLEGSQSRTLPDSSLILAAYEKWGGECPEHLLGDWSFAVWDRTRRRLFLARDHHGNTGIYYYQKGPVFAFSSGLKGILSLPGETFEPFPLRIAQVLLAWLGNPEATCYKDLLRLPPAHSLTLTEQGVSVRRYWHPERTPELRFRSDDEYVEAFLEVFARAVRCRLRTLGEVAVALSGGLDSGSVTAIAARELGVQGRRLQTYTSIPLHEPGAAAGLDRTTDEGPLVELVARRWSNLDTFYVKAESLGPVDGLRRALELFDEPRHGAPNFYWILALMREAQGRGVRTLLTGQGGNATISWNGAGYLAQELARGHLRKFFEELYGLKRVSGRPLWRLLAGQARQLLSLPSLGQLGNTLLRRGPWVGYSAIHMNMARELGIHQRMRRKGHDPYLQATADPVKNRLRTLQPGASPVGFYWQETGAGFEMEVRDPTLDRRVIDYCFAIPQDQYFRNGWDRWLIRRAMADKLPGEVVWNTRRGKQAADLVHRLKAGLPDLQSAYEKMRESELVGKFLDRRRIDDVIGRLVENGVDSKISYETETVVMRGLMVGMFLLRFEPEE